MLIQLPNGDWVDPTDVKLVFRRDNSEVTVETTSGFHTMPVSSTVEAADALRDQIAEQVNRALYKPEGV